MSNQSRITSLLASATLLLLSSSGTSAAETCSKKDEQPLEFRFFTDNNSWKDNGWILECEYDHKANKDNSVKELVWEVPIGSIKKESHTEVIREAACIPDTATCYLNIFDASGDGLQGDKKESSKSFSGWFAFLHGATTIATYKSQENPKFSELSYCVGPKCHKKPQEVKSNDKDCQDMVYLAMQLDNEPQETSYQLICGGEEDGLFDKRVVWDGNGFTEPGAYVEEETCLPKDACCEFIVVDGSSNGLTDAIDESSKDGSPMGFIYLEKNYEPVLEYNGNTGETFGVLTKRFACGADDKSSKEEEKDLIVATEAVNIPEVDDVESESSGESIEEDKEEEEEEVEEDEESDVEILNNLQGAFDPEKEEEIVAAVEEVYEERPEDFLNPDKEDDIVAAVEEVYDQEEKAFEEIEETSEDTAGNNVESESSSSSSSGSTGLADLYIEQTANVLDFDADFTWPPTTANWVEDDDFGHVGFGGYHGFTDDVYQSLTDDVFHTRNPSFWDFIATSSPTSGSSMESIDNMIKDLTDKTPKLPSDPDALNLLEGKGRKVGMTRNAKIVIGILVPLFLLWSIGLVLYYFREKLGERFGATEENDISVGKGDNTLRDAQSDVSLSEESVSDNASDNV